MMQEVPDGTDCNISNRFYAKKSDPRPLPVRFRSDGTLNIRCAAAFGDWFSTSTTSCHCRTKLCHADGPINGLTFRAHVEQFLVQTLAPGDIVIMDNLG